MLGELPSIGSPGEAWLGNLPTTRTSMVGVLLRKTHMHWAGSYWQAGDKHPSFLHWVMPWQ